MKGFAALSLLLLLYSPVATAQSGFSKADHELELWTGGGHSVNGGVGHIGVWNVGLRYGRILTGPHGPGILRGQFEYGVDVVPVFWVIEPNATAYGFALDPIALKWNFQRRRRAIPYLEASGGTLFTNRQVPPGISRVNFASGGAAGFYFPVGKYFWNADLRYMHISNAGLTNPNPGVNTVQVRLGVSLFRHRK